MRLLAIYATESEGITEVLVELSPPRSMDTDAAGSYRLRLHVNGGYMPEAAIANSGNLYEAARNVWSYVLSELNCTHKDNPWCMATEAHVISGHIAEKVDPT